MTISITRSINRRLTRSENVAKRCSLEPVTFNGIRFNKVIRVTHQFRKGPRTTGNAIQIRHVRVISNINSRQQRFRHTNRVSTTPLVRANRERRVLGGGDRTLTKPFSVFGKLIHALRNAERVTLRLVRLHVTVSNNRQNTRLVTNIKSRAFRLINNLLLLVRAKFCSNRRKIRQNNRKTSLNIFQHKEGALTRIANYGFHNNLLSTLRQHRHIQSSRHKRKTTRRRRNSTSRGTMSNRYFSNISLINRQRTSVRRNPILTILLRNRQRGAP